MMMMTMAQSYRAHVKIIEARNLKSTNVSGFCDPYCRLQIGDDKKKSQKTKAAKKTLNPKWQETFLFEGVTKGDRLEVEVRNWNVVNSKIIGTASFSFSSLLPPGLKPHHEIWLPIKETKEGTSESGEVHLLIALATGTEVVDLDTVRLARQEVEEGNSIFIVEILEGRNLAVKDLTGTSDPYCILQILPSSLSPPSSSSSTSSSSSSSPSLSPRSDHSPHSSSVKQRTCIVFKSLDPVWNEEFFFQMPFDCGTLSVEVWDWDRIGSHDAMGIVRLPLSKFQDELVRDEWYPLSPIKKEKVSGDIRMRAQFTSALNAQKSYQLAKNHLSLLCNIVTDNDCILATGLLQLYESQELARAMVHVFHSQCAVNSLLNHCFHRDIKRTSSETTLFRTDSPATRTTIVYFKLEDKESSWLSKTLLPLINRILQNPMGYEVDPEKAKEDRGDVKANAKNLLAVAQQFLDSIIGSFELCPLTIRLVLSNLRRLVTQAFPNSGLMAVGGILFLRFICPSIFAPEGFGLVATPPTAEARRALTLIAKILQNLVNGVEFGGKEQFMVDFNPFIINNARRITEFLNRLSQPPCNIPPSAQCAQEELVKSVSVVVKNLMSNFDKVEAAVLKEPRVSVVPRDAAAQENTRAQLAQLRALLVS